MAANGPLRGEGGMFAACPPGRLPGKVVMMKLVEKSNKRPTLLLAAGVVFTFDLTWLIMFQSFKCSS